MPGYASGTGNTLPWGTSVYNGVRQGPTRSGLVDPAGPGNGPSRAVNATLVPEVGSGYGLGTANNAVVQSSAVSANAGCATATGVVSSGLVLKWRVLQAASSSSGAGTEQLVGLADQAMTAGTKIIAVTEGTRSNYPTTTTVVTDVVVRGGGGGALLAHFTKITASHSTNGGSIDNDLEVWVLDTPPAMVGTVWPTYEIAAIFVPADGGSGQAMSCFEVSGLQVGTAVDGTPGVLGGYASALGSPSYATSVTGEFLLYAYTDWGSNVAISVPAGYTAVGTTGSHGIEISNSSGIVVPACKPSTAGTETGTFGNQTANQIRNVAMVAFPAVVPGTVGAGAAGGTASTGAAVPWSRRQAWGADFGATNSPSFALQTTNIQWGSKLVCVVTAANGTGSPGCTSVDDGNGHNFTLVDRISNTNGSTRNMELSVWTLDVHAGIVGTKPTITAHLVNCATSAGSSFFVQEITGLGQTGVLDGTPVHSTQFATGTSYAVPAYTSTAANEYLFYCYGNDGFTNDQLVYPAGTSPDGTNTLAFAPKALGGYKNSTASTETGSWTTSSSANLLAAQIVIAFKLADTGANATTTTAIPAPVNAGNATGTGAANNASITTALPVGAASATGTAYNATISSRTFPAGVTITERGRGTSTTTTLDVTFTGPVAVGSVVVLRIVASNSGAGGAARSIQAFSDPRSAFLNLKTRIGTTVNNPGLNLGVAIYTYYTVVGAAYQAGDVLTVNWAAAPASSGMVVEEWSGIETTAMPAADSATAFTSATANTANATLTPISLSDVVGVHEGWMNASSDTYTGDSDTLDGLWVSQAQLKATSWHSESQYKVTQSTPQQSHQGTLAASAPSATLAFRLPARVPPYSGVATGTGTAYGASIGVSGTAGTSTATGTAYNAATTSTSGVTANAGLATGSVALHGTYGATGVTYGGMGAYGGTTFDPTARVAPTPTAGTSTGTGYGATDNITIGTVTAATATGAAYNPAITSGSNTVAFAGNATGTGTAYAATITATGTAHPTVATGTGTAFNPTTAVTVNAGLATATGTAYNPSFTASVSIAAGAATATGTAFTPTITTTARPTAGVALGTFLANNPTVSATASVAATVATGTGGANSSSTQVSLASAVATAIGTAFNPTIVSGADKNVQPGVATGTGTAFNPTITATGNPNAGLATATGIAFNPTAVPSRTAPATAAVATGVAFNATVTSASTANPNAGLATATGVAFQPSITASSHLAAGLATATGVAFNATATTASVTNVTAQAAFAAGVAYQPTIIVTGAAPAGLASATGVSFNATCTVTFIAQVATGSGAANQAVATVTVTAQPALAVGGGYPPSIVIAVTVRVATATGVAYEAIAISSAAGIAQIWVVIKTTIYKRNQKVSVLETSRQTTAVLENKQKTTVLENRQKLTVEERRNKITVKEGEDVPRT